MKKIAILASGAGTNAENIARHFAGSDRARVTLVLTNVRDAGVVGRMAQLGIDTYYVPNAQWRDQPGQIADFLESQGIDLVVLAGFMRKVADVLVERFRGRMLNIHPSLLPAYGGKGMYGHHVHEAVIAAHETQSGVTVHQVSEEMDGGAIVARQSVEVTPGDTPETLEAKIHPVEYELYPRAIEQVLDQLDGADTSDSSESSTSSCAEQWASALGMKGYSDAEAERRQAAATPPPMPPTPPAYVPARMADAPGCVPASPGPQFSTPEAAPRMPSTYLLWSVLCIVFCCTVFGIVATVFSCQVSSKYYNGDYEGAERASRRAQAWIIVSFAAGVLQATIFTPLYMLMTM